VKTVECPWPHIQGGDDPAKYPVPNVATEEGRALGREVARMADAEYQRTGRDARCETCAFRGGEHIANGSPATLMSAVKCVMEGTPFYCHETERPCGGWTAAMAAIIEADKLEQLEQ
jgi:hypothetical protein